MLDQLNLIEKREAAHFDSLIEKSGDTWWGNQTYAGRKRLARRVAHFLDVMQQTDCSRVLEVGCGIGSTAEAVLSQIPALEYHACDVSQRALYEIRQKCGDYSGFKLIPKSFRLVTAEEGRYDLVFGNGILHHIGLQQALTVLKRVLKKDGVISFFEPNLANPQILAERRIPALRKWGENSPDEVAYSRWQIQRALIGNGFQDVSVEPYEFMYPLTPKWLVPMIDSVGRIAEATPIVREIAGSLKISARI